jgi:hypothetical protein
MVKKAVKKSNRKVTKSPVRKSASVKSLKKKKVSTFWGLFSIFTVLVLALIALTKSEMLVQDAHQEVLSAQDQLGK